VIVVDEPTQPLDLDAWRQALWKQLRKLVAQIEIQSQEMKLMRLKIEWLEHELKELREQLNK
jgi:hypothetical protein